MERRGFIGGSDAPIIIGDSPFQKTKIDLFLEKTGRKTFEVNNEFVTRGRLLEESVLKFYEHYNNVSLNSKQEKIFHKKYPFLVGSVDASYLDRKNNKVLVEAKTAACNIQTWNNEIPKHYRAQCAFYSLITGCERVDMAVLFSGFVYGQFTYYKDHEYEDMILEKCVDFWHNNILADKMPDIQAESDIGTIFPSPSADGYLLANDNIVEQIEEIKNVQKKLEVLTKELESKKLEILKYLGDSCILKDKEGKGVLATYKPFVSNRLDTKSLKEKLPEICEQYVLQTTSRVFRIRG
jgi:putative phage-type endonuclease